MSNETQGLELRSLVKSSGELELSLATVSHPDPGPDEILVRVQASPITTSPGSTVTWPMRTGAFHSTPI